MDRIFYSFIIYCYYSVEMYSFQTIDMESGIMEKKKKIWLYIYLFIMIFIWLYFIMPIPFIQPLWKIDIARSRMVYYVEDRLTGLSRNEVIELLGEPDLGYDAGYGPPGLTLYYRLNSRYLFIIILDENNIVVSYYKSD